MADSISISLTIDLPGGKTVTQEFTSDEPIMIGCISCREEYPHA